MTVVPLGSAAEVDAPAIGAAPQPPPPAAQAFADVLGGALGAATTALGRADSAETAFAAGRGGLQEMVLERAQADVALSIASAAASRAAQSLSTILGMQI